MRERCRSPNTVGCLIDRERNQSNNNATPLPFQQHKGCQSADEHERKEAREKEYQKNYRETHRDDTNKKARDNPKAKESRARYKESHKPAIRDQARARDQRQAEAERQSLEERLETTTDPEERRYIKGKIDRSDAMKERAAARKDKQGAESLATMGGYGWHTTGPDDFQGRGETRSQRRPREDSDSERERERERKRREKDKKGDGRTR